MSNKEAFIKMMATQNATHAAEQEHAYAFARATEDLFTQIQTWAEGVDGLEVSAFLVDIEQGKIHYQAYGFSAKFGDKSVMFVPVTHAVMHYQGTGDLKGLRLPTSLNFKRDDGQWVIARNGERTALDEESFFALLTDAK